MCTCLSTVYFPLEAMLSICVCACVCVCVCVCVCIYIYIYIFFFLPPHNYCGILCQCKHSDHIALCRFKARSGPQTNGSMLATLWIIGKRVWPASVAWPFSLYSCRCSWNICALYVLDSSVYVLFFFLCVCIYMYVWCVEFIYCFAFACCFASLIQLCFDMSFGRGLVLITEMKRHR